jgi:hypothetical protein
MRSQPVFKSDEAPTNRYLNVMDKNRFYSPYNSQTMVELDKVREAYKKRKEAQKPYGSSILTQNEKLLSKVASPNQGESISTSINQTPAESNREHITTFNPVYTERNHNSSHSPSIIQTKVLNSDQELSKRSKNQPIQMKINKLPDQTLTFYQDNLLYTQPIWAEKVNID